MSMLSVLVMGLALSAPTPSKDVLVEARTLMEDGSGGEAVRMLR